MYLQHFSETSYYYSTESTKSFKICSYYVEMVAFFAKISQKCLGIKLHLNNSILFSTLSMIIILMDLVLFYLYLSVSCLFRVSFYLSVGILLSREVIYWVSLQILGWVTTNRKICVLICKISQNVLKYF